MWCCPCFCYGSLEVLLVLLHSLVFQPARARAVVEVHLGSSSAGLCVVLYHATVVLCGVFSLFCTSRNASTGTRGMITVKTRQRARGKQS